MCVSRSRFPKILALLLACCMVFSMTACNGKETEEPVETTEKTEAETETEEKDLSALGTSTLVELGEYKGLSYVPMDTTVTDAEVEEKPEIKPEEKPEIKPEEKPENKPVEKPEDPEDPKAPKTGDSTNVMLWILLMATGCGMVVLGKRKKSNF